MLKLLNIPLIIIGLIAAAILFFLQFLFMFLLKCISAIIRDFFKLG